MTLARFCKSHLHRYLSTKALMCLTKYTVGMLKNSGWCLWPRTYAKKKSCYSRYLLTKACNGHIFFTCFWMPNVSLAFLKHPLMKNLWKYLCGSTSSDLESFWIRVFLLFISTTRNLVVKWKPGFEHGTFSFQVNLVWAVLSVTGWERLRVNNHWLACRGVWPLSIFAVFPAHFNHFSLIGVMFFLSLIRPVQ